MKTKDERPERGMWAPGNYLNTCSGCGETFLGAKYAGLCADCAYGTPSEDERLEFAQDLVADLVRENTELRRTLAEMVGLAERWITSNKPEGKKEEHVTR